MKYLKRFNENLESDVEEDWYKFESKPTGPMKVAADEYVDKMKKETNYKDEKIHLEYAFYAGAKWSQKKYTATSRN